MYSQKIFSLTIGLLLLFALSTAWAQHTYKGKVLDRSNKKPLNGAHVHWSEGDITTLTDENGEFSLISDADQLILRITFVGYKSQTVKLTAEKPAVILLQKSMEVMSPVTVLARKVSTARPVHGCNFDRQPLA